MEHSVNKDRTLPPFLIIPFSQTLSVMRTIPPASENSGSALGGIEGKLGRIIDTLADGSMSVMTGLLEDWVEWVA
jgi:hypothetical protein